MERHLRSQARDRSRSRDPRREDKIALDASDYTVIKYPKRKQAPRKTDDIKPGVFMNILIQLMMVLYRFSEVLLGDEYQSLYEDLKQKRLDLLLDESKTSKTIQRVTKTFMEDPENVNASDGRLYEIKSLFNFITGLEHTAAADEKLKLTELARIDAEIDDLNNIKFTDIVKFTKYLVKVKVAEPNAFDNFKMAYNDKSSAKTRQKFIDINYENLKDLYVKNKQQDQDFSYHMQKLGNLLVSIQLETKNIWMSNLKRNVEEFIDEIKITFKRIRELPEGSMKKMQIYNDNFHDMVDFTKTNMWIKYVDTLTKFSKFKISGRMPDGMRALFHSEFQFLDIKPFDKLTPFIDSIPHRVIKITDQLTNYIQQGELLFTIPLSLIDKIDELPEDERESYNKEFMSHMTLMLGTFQNEGKFSDLWVKDMTSRIAERVSDLLIVEVSINQSSVQPSFFSQAMDILDDRYSFIEDVDPTEPNVQMSMEEALVETHVEDFKIKKFKHGWFEIYTNPNLPELRMPSKVTLVQLRHMVKSNFIILNRSNFFDGNLVVEAKADESNSFRPVDASQFPNMEAIPQPETIFYDHY